MEHLFTLYLITRLDVIWMVSVFLAICFAFAVVVVVTIGYLEGRLDRAKQAIKNLLIAGACSLAVFVITPTQKDAMFIAGGIGVIEAAKSETAQRVASQSIDAIERWLASVAPKKE